MIGFVAFLDEEVAEAPTGILHKNPIKARKARGELRKAMNNPIAAKDAMSIVGKHTNHAPLLNDIKHAEQNYPQADVRPLIKTHIKRLKIPHMGV